MNALLRSIFSSCQEWAVKAPTLLGYWCCNAFWECLDLLEVNAPAQSKHPACILSSSCSWFGAREFLRRGGWCQQVQSPQSFVHRQRRQHGGSWECLAFKGTGFDMSAKGNKAMIPQTIKIMVLIKSVVHVWIWKVPWDPHCSRHCIGIINDHWWRQGHLEKNSNQFRMSVYLETAT